MSPVHVALLTSCVLLTAVALAVAAAVTVRLRRLTAHVAGVEGSLLRLAERVEGLARREAAREAAEEASAREAEWVITYDGDGPSAPTDGRRAVAASQVVGTAFGEPLLKVAALSHGVRQALREEKRAHLAYQVRREYRRRRRESRARARAEQRGATRRAAVRAEEPHPREAARTRKTRGRTAQ